jgi:DNA-binding NarL/FixJ family response regulator
VLGAIHGHLKQIAQTLGIADSTVNIHVSYVLRKLGCTSRTQVAALILSASARKPGAHSN